MSTNSFSRGNSCLDSSICIQPPLFILLFNFLFGEGGFKNSTFKATGKGWADKTPSGQNPLGQNPLRQNPLGQNPLTFLHG